MPIRLSTIMTRHSHNNKGLNCYLDGNLDTWTPPSTTHTQYLSLSSGDLDDEFKTR